MSHTFLIEQVLIFFLMMSFNTIKNSIACSYLFSFLQKVNSSWFQSSSFYICRCTCVCMWSTASIVGVILFVGVTVLSHTHWNLFCIKLFL